MDENCKFAFTGPRAAEIEHDAVCRFLNVLTPSEVKNVRKQLNLTQAAFAEQTGIGIASINRWENADYIQSRAMDNYLYL